MILEIYKNRAKQEDDVSKIQKQLAELTNLVSGIDKNLKVNSELTLSHARVTLAELGHKYLKQNFIPIEEYTYYKMLGEAYVAAGGNRGFEVVFNHVLETVPVRETEKVS